MDGRNIYATVLNFIGNYNNAGIVKRLLCKEGRAAYGDKETVLVPPNCYIDFDLQLLDIFAQMKKGRQPLRMAIKKEYYRIKELLGRRPNRLDCLRIWMDAQIYEQCLKHPKESPFKRYLDFLAELKDLTPSEQEIRGSVVEELLQEVANTPMTKVYNMPVRFLQSEFLESRDGWAIVLCGAMEQYQANEAVFRHFQDIVEYRAKDYYRRRYLWQAK